VILSNRKLTKKIKEIVFCWELYLFLCLILLAGLVTESWKCLSWKGPPKGHLVPHSAMQRDTYSSIRYSDMGMLSLKTVKTILAAVSRNQMWI